MNQPAPGAWIRARTIAKRALIVSHRWAGIVLGLMAVMWFATGVAMIYAGGMPRITPQQRLDHLPVLDLASVKLGPAQAAERIGGEEAMPGTPQLVMVMERPAYRFPEAGNATVFADDGSELAPIDEAAAARVARQFLREPAPDLQLVRQVDEPDQWTLQMRRGLPLLKFAVGDAQGTELYVSTTQGEVVQATTRRDRGLAWIATIPHWLYFSGLRQNQPLWYWMVVGLSGLVCLLALMGLVLAFTQWRRTRPFDLKRAIPYRGGMRWHYIAGSLFGVFAVTWAFSGLLSMEPFAWTTVREMYVPPDALSGGEPELARYAAVDLQALPALATPGFIKEISYPRIHGDHYLRLRTSLQADAKARPLERLHAPYRVGGKGPDGDVLVNAATLSRHEGLFDEAVILERLRAAVPGAPVVSQELLQDYDDYYYSRSYQAPLPVLRVKYGDALGTWLYIDPRNSELVGNVHRYSRVERWLYNGLHSLDFRFWYSKRPLWDLGMITLLLGGLVGSSLGLYYGIRRLVKS